MFFFIAAERFFENKMNRISPQHQANISVPTDNDIRINLLFIFAISEP